MNQINFHMLNRLNAKSYLLCRIGNALDLIKSKTFLITDNLNLCELLLKTARGVFLLDRLLALPQFNLKGILVIDKECYFLCNSERRGGRKSGENKSVFRTVSNLFNRIIFWSNIHSIYCLCFNIFRFLSIILLA